MKNLLFLLSFILLLNFSCSQKVDVEKIKEELMNADLEFSKLSIEKGKNQAFSDYVHPDGVLLRNDGMPLKGKASLDSMQMLRTDSGYSLKWKPVFADATQSGDLGYTYGIWLMTTKDTSMMGTYATVWKKDEYGNWKFILDTGNQGLGKDEAKEKTNF
jgi:ketosteroid isomerase-like protein